MSKILVNVHYHFVGEGWTRRAKSKAEACYMDFRNDCIEVANPKIESLNSLWNSLYPDTDLVNNDKEMETYNRFMAYHFNQLTESIRNRNKDFTGYFDPEYDTSFVLINKTGGKMYATITLV